jgi:hypothetical protein
MANPNAQLAKRSSTVFLQVVIMLIGVGVLTLLLWEPHIEGRNRHATAFEVYFKDPFLAYVYAASVPFFVALYQGFRVLGLVAENNVFSPAAVRALRIIKYCAIAIIGFVVVSVVFMSRADPDDGPPGVVMRILVLFPSIVVAAAAGTFQRILQSAVELKSESDLTV